MISRTLALALALVAVTLASLLSLSTESAESTVLALEPETPTTTLAEETRPATLELSASSKFDVSLDSVKSERPDHEPSRRAVELAPPNGMVSIHVTDETGAPLALASVYAIAKSARAYEAEPSWTRPSRLPHESQLRGATDADGDLLFEELPANTYRLGAWSWKRGYSVSESFELGAERPGRALALELEPVPLDRMISGDLIDPLETSDQRPWVRWVTVVNGREFESYEGVHIAPGGTEFYVVPKQGVESGTIRASRTDRFEDSTEWNRESARFALAESVEPGMHGLRLELAKPRLVPIDVRTAFGERVEEWSAKLATEVEGQWTQPSSVFKLNRDFPPLTEDRQVRIPLERFQLTIEALGYVPVTLGPFQEPDVPTSFEVELRRMPRVRGSVLASDEFIQSSVQLVEAHPAEGKRAATFQRASTNSDGQFSILTPLAGSFVAVVTSERGWEVRSAPFELDGIHDLSGLVIDLGLSASIRGTLKVPEDSTALSWHVVFQDTQQEQRFFSLKLSDSLTFDSGPLRPGTWAVYHTPGQETPEGLDESMAGWWAEQLPWYDAWRVGATPRLVTLEPGECLELDLDATASPEFELRGTLHVTDRTPSRSGDEQRTVLMCATGYTVSPFASLLDESDRRISTSWRTEVGGFVLGSHSPGQFELSISWEDPFENKLVITDGVELSGKDQEWSASFEVAEIRVLAGPEEKRRYSRAAFETTLQNGARVECPFRWVRKPRYFTLPGVEPVAIETDFLGEHALGKVPAGTGTLRIYDSATEEWIEQLVKVGPGEERIIELP